MAGKILGDTEIRKAIKDGLLEVSELDVDGVDLRSADCRIQPSSLDLTVGQIFDPPKDMHGLDNLERWPQPLMGLRLLPGHSAIVETQQTLKLSNQISAFGFPPAHLARKALLMTNPGHIDPGYEGKLTFTVINLGRETIYLDRSDIIVTLLLFRLEGEGAKHGYADRRADQPKKTEEGRRKSRSRLLNTLAPDFGDFTQRMEIAAEKAVNRTLAREEMKKYWVSAAAVAVAAIVSAGIGFFKDTRTMDKLYTFNASNQVSVGELGDRLSRLEAEAKNREAIQGLETIALEVEELRRILEDLRADTEQLR
ncbi:dCTP deaminase [Phycobacter sp. K97]|uniref:dCTP deaminase n=1 Tax=Phycobacter sedimenti TaxID=3133977 RepID=UPI00311E256C